MKTRLRQILSAMQGKHALVVGDLYLDEYLVGRPSKISREAPVMVLEHIATYSQPGGGAAPAVNVTSMKGIAHSVGIVGDDEPGRTLLAHLSTTGIDVAPVVVHPGRPTTRKLRIVAQGSLRLPQQMLRVDFQDRTPVDRSVAELLINKIQSLLPQMQLVLMSDYLSGVVTEEVARTVLELASSVGAVTVADAQGDLHKYAGYKLVKCNRDEAASFLGWQLEGVAQCAAAAKELATGLGLEWAMVTMGPEGLVLAQHGKSWHLPALRRVEVYDVTGAGDAVVAAAGLALAARATGLEASVLANLAGGVAVQRWGNAPVSKEDLDQAIEDWDGEIFEDPDRA